MIVVNGVEMPHSDVDVRTFLVAQGYPTDRVAVERNEEIVPRARYGQTRIVDGDRLEIVHFMGGG